LLRENFLVESWLNRATKAIDANSKMIKLRAVAIDIRFMPNGANVQKFGRKATVIPSNPRK